MKIVYMMCRICDGWYSPRAHDHCPYCAALKIGRQHVHHITGIQIVRAVPRPIERIVAFRSE